jgi:hypothetical protein
MMLPCDELGQRKAVMIPSVVVMSALAAGQTGNSIRAKPPRGLDKAQPTRNRKST